MARPDILIAGGGAAGFFAAIAAAESGTRVVLLEKSAGFLAKVRISGGGRCNVTHASFEPRELAECYPRGGRALIGPLGRFGPADTVDWFAARGVRLKTESDGRMFPVSNNSETIVSCLIGAAHGAGVEMRHSCGIRSVQRRGGGGFTIATDHGDTLHCDRLLLATGGCRAASMAGLAMGLGHSIQDPVPSLFTLQIETPWLRTLAGVAVRDAAISVPGTTLHERGPLLATHWGLSGPAVLRLSAWGARELHGLDHRFSLTVNWLPDLPADEIAKAFEAHRATQGARRVANIPPGQLPARLWEQIARAAGISTNARWSALTHSHQTRLATLLHRTVFPVTGKSLNKDEFVTCGGVRLTEVNFKTMESRICPGLFFAGELLDIDGITGGFNFQAAWTTGWIAGQSMAARP